MAAAWLGERHLVELLVTGVVAGGHILIEDVPGVGKTTLAKALATAFGLSFNRVQFTSDTLPADVLGGSVYHPARGEFDFVPGPIFTDFLLADEINRAPTRSQSAFLQAMEEGQVAVDGLNHPLPPSFTVVATQNPIDFESTHPLPEAQLDRFLIATPLGYPDDDSECALLANGAGVVSATVRPVLAAAQLPALREAAAAVWLHPDLAAYIVALARATRSDERLRLGISPRGALHLAQAARAHALVTGAEVVHPEHLHRLLEPVWAHRLLPRHGRDPERAIGREVLRDVRERVQLPR